MTLELGEAIALGGTLIPLAVAAASLEANRLIRKFHGKQALAIEELRDGLGLLLRHFAGQDEEFKMDLATYAHPLYESYVANVPKTNNRSRSPHRSGRR